MANMGAAHPEVGPELPATRQAITERDVDASSSTEPDYLPYRFEPGRRIDLSATDPDGTDGYAHKDEAELEMKE